MNKPNLNIEQKYYDEGYKYIVGVDEVGRGSLISVVVAAAVYIPEGFDHSAINDSKKLSEAKRISLASYIMDTCCYSIAEVDHKYIDDNNIINATKKAMQKAVSKHSKADFAIIDGNFLPLLKINAINVIKGDSKSVSIAAASIIAKVYRDALIKLLHLEYPEYGWFSNKGYGTKQHIEAIKKYGPTEYHRKSFLKKILE